MQRTFRTKKFTPGRIGFILQIYIKGLIEEASIKNSVAILNASCNTLLLILRMNAKNKNKEGS